MVVTETGCGDGHQQKSLKGNQANSGPVYHHIPDAGETADIAKAFDSVQVLAAFHDIWSYLAGLFL